MPHETDLPCTECGSALEERRERLDGTPMTGDADRLTLAVCSRCGVVHYPADTLRELDRANSHRRSGS
jgi:NMD protein affecting ribosome stability and mRNA decay